MKKIAGGMLLGILLVSLLFHTAEGFGADTPEKVRDEAFAKLKVADNLMHQANKLIAETPGDDDMKAAMQLYSQAGRLFQEAGMSLQVLGSDYVSPDDVAGCDQAVQACMKAITGIKNVLMSRQK